MNLHDSEKVVGRITKARTWDKRFRTPDPAPSHPDDATLKEFLFALVVIVLFVTAGWLWAGILAALQVTP